MTRNIPDHSVYLPVLDEFELDLQARARARVSESEREFVLVGASEIFFSLSLSEKISARCSRVASDCIVTCTVRTTVADA